MTSRTIHFSSGKTKIVVTHEKGSSYWVNIKSGVYSFGRSTIVEVFSPKEDLAFHKAAMDVLLESPRRIASCDLQWMRHRSGDDGDPMLVLSRVHSDS
jgi:hypothetical protein